jgi:hypothetical protein
MSPFNPFASNAQDDSIADEARGSMQKLDEVRSSVDSQEKEMLDDKGLNPTLTFEEGRSANAIPNTSKLTIPNQIRQGVWVVT